MAAIINVPESHADLLANPATAVLTTIGADGLPQSTAVWYLVDDDDVLKTSVDTSRQKYKNLVRTPKATLFLIDPANPFRTLEIRANVELVADPDKIYVQKAADRYSTPVEVLDTPDSVRSVIVFDPQHVVAFG
jgi:PPOX class probable F420-dependent enzyme